MLSQKRHADLCFKPRGLFFIFIRKESLHTEHLFRGIDRYDPYARPGGPRGDPYDPYDRRPLPPPYERERRLPPPRDPYYERYERDPYARDPYARDPYARYPLPPPERDPYRRLPPRDPYARAAAYESRDPYARPPPEYYYDYPRRSPERSKDM